MRVLTMVVATTAPLQVYGGIQIAREALVTNAESFPTIIELGHDDRQRLDAKVIRAWVVDREDGESELRAEVEISDESLERLGETRGVSMGFTVPFIEAEQGDARAKVLIAADAAHFGDELLEVAAEILDREFAASAARSYQLSADALASVLLSMPAEVWQTAGGVLANLIYDVLRGFIGASRRNATSIFEMTRSKDEVVLRLETDDVETLRRAVESGFEFLRDAPTGSGYEFDDAASTWTAYRRPD